MLKQSTPSNPDLDHLVRQLPELVNGDDWLVYRGRYVRLDFVIEIDTAVYYVSVDRGRVSIDSTARLTPAYSFAFRASSATWAKFWQQMPPPPFHDIFAMSHLADLRIEGDLRPLMANLMYFKDVLGAPRQLDRKS